jgi:hypothetical protein
MNTIYGRITLGAGIVLALVLCARSSSAQEHPSARIYSLGGEHVSGVIPDLYTDLTVNPANVAFADRLTINYDRRSIYGFAPVFPYLSENPQLSYSRDSYMANELSIYGIGLSSWRAAIFAQVRLSKSEYNTSANDIYNSGTAIGSQDQWSDSDNDFGRIDLIAARSLGSAYALGLRLQVWGYYKSYATADGETDDYYRDVVFADLDNEYERTNAGSYTGRRISFDFQAGLIKKSDGGSQTDLVLQASVHPLNYAKQSASLSIQQYYNEGEQVDSYSYRRETWSDARKGDLWIFGLSMRHAFSGGMRIYTGGKVSLASYDAQWSQSQQNYSWDGQTLRADNIIGGGFACGGTLRGASYFLKGGRKFGLRDNLDLYLGLHGDFGWNHATEEPIMRYSETHREDTSSILIDEPTSLEYTGTEASLYLPLSIEFRPSSYFSVFSGFTIYGEWYKYVTTQPVQSFFYYSRPGDTGSNSRVLMAAASPNVTIFPTAATSNWQRAWDSGSTVTLGFSFHYQERFFIDVYSASEIIPGNLASSLIDVRYVF